VRLSLDALKKYYCCYYYFHYNFSTIYLQIFFFQAVAGRNSGWSATEVHLKKPGCVWLQVIQTDGPPDKLTYMQSTDQIWVEQTLELDSHHHYHHHQQQQSDSDNDDESDDAVGADVLVIRQASEHLLHRVVHLDNDPHQQSQPQQSGSQQSYGHDEDNGERRFIAVRRRSTHSVFY